ncbi:hypothetical protein ZEAMMB73_Zm00001d035561 [Zea mays]|uniref:Uncharacterized protein n=1 Tax=Zea mays TaxID=4577 RepID=A0A1D6LHA4_MAIZE|nr:hypothetical protein ZEAMMB73_Zm00001d035561 [Zea mays]
MENPAPSIVVAIAAPVAAEFVKLTFRALYMRRAGPGSREMTVPGRPSDQLGRRVVTDSHHGVCTASPSALAVGWTWRQCSNDRPWRRRGCQGSLGNIRRI